MKTQTHTPTPKVIKPPTPIRYRNGGLIDAEETSFASVPYEPVGQYIVHAVNTHEELVAALKYLTSLTYNTVNYDQSDADTLRAVDRAEKAIAKAEGSDDHLTNKKH